jgi:TIGR03009 family protein
MRALGWSIAIPIFTATVLLAQQPPTGQPAPTPPLNVPTNDPLPTLLQQWEQRMKSIQAIEARDIVRTETDRVTGTQEIYQGTARFLRPNRAELYMQKQKNPEVYERFLMTGNLLYEFVPREKVIRAHQLPQQVPGQPAFDDNFMSLLFGMTAQQAQQRYELRLVPKPEDKWYYYMTIKPRMAADKREFSEARLVLWQQTMLPRQIEFVGPQGNTIKWEIPKIDTNAQLGPKDFVMPKLPANWTMKQEPPPPLPGPGAPGGPRPSTVRPSGGP